VQGARENEPVHPATLPTTSEASHHPDTPVPGMIHAPSQIPPDHPLPAAGDPPLRGLRSSGPYAQAIYISLTSWRGVFRQTNRSLGWIITNGSWTMVASWRR
jgi:hypothetical protein